MFEFIEYVLWELKNSLGLALLAGTAAAGVLGAAWVVHKKKYAGQRKFPWGRAVLYLVLAGYLAVVLYATLLRGSGSYRQVNLHLFRAWREAWNNFSAKNWANVLLNVAMFVPLGFLLPLLWKRFRRWFVTIPAGLGVSLAIELAQLAIGRGICDVDDLFANTLGGAMGYFAAMTVLALFREKGKRLKPCIGYGCLTLALVMPICGIFIAYEVQEYGNLPGAAAYTNDTRDTRWVLECQLPEAGKTMAVYRTQTRSLAECDAFAEEFRQIVGADYGTISYYQEAAYYMDHGGDDGWHHFLFVSYMDTGYTYTAGCLEDPVWADCDRETLVSALSKYPVLIPDYAEFTLEGEGWHSFTVDQHVDGAVMVDGTLRCRWAADGTVREIENGLLSYTYYNDAEVIGPEEAYAQLCAGKFYDSGYFEKRAPEAVIVTGCTLGYAVDTKGFYQPVYRFQVVSEDGSYGDEIMIPAIR